jgi:hypothetical protein
LILQIEAAELLDPLPGIDLRREDVSLPVGGDVVQLNCPTCRPGRPKRPSVSFDARSTMRTSPFIPSIM